MTEAAGIIFSAIMFFAMLALASIGMRNDHPKGDL